MFVIYNFTYSLQWFNFVTLMLFAEQHKENSVYKNPIAFLSSNRLQMRGNKIRN